MYDISEGGWGCYQDKPQREVEQVSLQDILCLYFQLQPILRSGTMVLI